MKSLIPWRRRNGQTTHFDKDREDLFSRFLGVPMRLNRSSFSGESRFPSVDVSEGRKDIIVKAEITGVDRKHIDITLEGRSLTIKGEKNTKKKNRMSAIIVSKVPLDIIREPSNCRQM